MGANLLNHVKDATIHLNEGYINAIYPLSPAVYVCVRKHTVASLGVLSPSCPSLNIGFQSATGAFCASRECECVRGVTHTPDQCTQRGAVWLFPSPDRRRFWRTRIRTRASYPRLCRCPEDPKRAARAPSMLPGCNGRFYPRLCGLCSRVSVSVFLSLPLLLRFLDCSCSGCLPSLSTGHARKLRHRNSRSRWRTAS